MRHRVIRMMVALCLAMPLWAAADQAAAMRRRVVAALASNGLVRPGALI